MYDPTSPHAGYCGYLPPVATQFKPGDEWTGNRKGRPKGAATKLERELEQELGRYVDADTTGDPRVTRRRRLVRALLDRIESGDRHAASLIFDRIWPVEPTSGQQTAVIINIDEQDRDA